MAPRWLEVDVGLTRLADRLCIGEARVATAEAAARGPRIVRTRRTRGRRRPSGDGGRRLSRRLASAHGRGQERGRGGDEGAVGGGVLRGFGAEDGEGHGGTVRGPGDAHVVA